MFSEWHGLALRRFNMATLNVSAALKSLPRDFPSPRRIYMKSHVKLIWDNWFNGRKLVVAITESRRFHYHLTAAIKGCRHFCCDADGNAVFPGAIIIFIEWVTRTEGAK